jgi:hypothetical protein
VMVIAAIARAIARSTRSAAFVLPSRQPYTTRDPKRAWRLLGGLARRLKHQHPGAAASPRAGLEETLTVMRLGLPANLERVASLDEVGQFEGRAIFRSS